MACSFWLPMCLFSHFSIFNTENMNNYQRNILVQIQNLIFNIYPSSFWYRHAVYSVGRFAGSIRLCYCILEFHISLGFSFSKTNAIKPQVLCLSVWEVDCQYTLGLQISSCIYVFLRQPLIPQSHCLTIELCLVYGCKPINLFISEINKTVQIALLFFHNNVLILLK